MGVTTIETCKKCQAHEEREESRKTSERANAAAKRAVSLVPGRQAAQITFSAEETNALVRILMYGGHETDRETERYFEKLGAHRVSYDMWHQVFCKASRADNELMQAKRDF